MMQAVSRNIVHWVREETQSNRLLPGLTSGALLGATEAIFSLSLGSLVFSGELSPYLPYGIGIALVTSIIMLVTISLTSRVEGVIGSTQDSTTVILGVIAATLVARLSVAPPEEMLTTILVAIAVTTLLTGVFYLALGFFKLGKLVRFIPYPVVGGFLAGTGWLLLQGSFGVMADFSLTFQNIPALLEPDQLILWVPGVLFALILWRSKPSTLRSSPATPACWSALPAKARPCAGWTTPTLSVWRQRSKRAGGITW
jgi:SulP family sulfate permease